MDITKISAKPRTQTGKTAAKRLRADGKVPAVAYWKGEAALQLAVAPKDVITSLKSAHGKNSVIELDVAGKKHTVLVRDYSYHPVTRELEHVDFIHIELDKPVDVEVPLTTSGKCAGVTAGGILRIVYRTLPIRSLPGQIPVKVDHDVTNLGLNEAVKASAIKLPEGVSVRLSPEQTVISVVAPEKERVEEAAPAAGAAAPAAGAAAAPAAGAAAKKDDKAAAPAKDAKKK